MNAADLRAALQCSKSSCPCHRGQNTHCPAHDDGNPSFTVNDAAGTVLFNCHVGCDKRAVIAALTERGLWPLSESVTPIRSTGRSEPDHLYVYQNAYGVTVGEKGRWDNPKTFKWRMPGESAWTGGPQMDAMPLYNLADVLRGSAAPVFVVEGEKAVDACRARGLVAVCTAGGAAQTRFGNAFDPIAQRDVILWPDNDDPGRALMAKIAALLPDASSVSPVVIPKGDAWDYFENGGTVESLNALLAEARTRAWVVSDDAVSAEVPVIGGSVRFDFTHMIAGPKSIEAYLKVQVNAVGSRRVPHTQRINLESASALTDLRRTLADIFPDKAMNWTAILSEARSEAVSIWRGIPRSVSAEDTELVTKREWLVEGLIPLRLTTIPFGMGGSLKSLLTAHLAIEAYWGGNWLGLPTRRVSGVLVIDYEDTAQEWRLRLEELCGGMNLPAPPGEAFRWMPGNGIPLVDQAEQVRGIIDQYGIELLIIDSAISAVGGDLIDTGSAQRLVNWLTSLGVTSVLIAHNTKAEDSQYPYGNIFWHNLPRSTVYVEATGEPFDRVREVSLTPRKASRGAIRPLGARVTFAGDGEPLTVESMDHAPTRKNEDEDTGAKYLIIGVLKSGPATIPEIVAATGLPAKTVDKTLRRNPSYFVAVGKRGVAVLWALLEESRSA